MERELGSQELEQTVQGEKGRVRSCTEEVEKGGGSVGQREHVGKRTLMIIFIDCEEFDRPYLP